MVNFIAPKGKFIVVGYDVCECRYYKLTQHNGGVFDNPEKAVEIASKNNGKRDVTSIEDIYHVLDDGGTMIY